MKYRATKKFQELTIVPNHQNLERWEFLAFRAGEVVDCKPPKELIDGGYIEAVKKEVKKDVSTE